MLITEHSLGWRVCTAPLLKTLATGLPAEASGLSTWREDRRRALAQQPMGDGGLVGGAGRRGSSELELEMEVPPLLLLLLPPRLASATGLKQVHPAGLARVPGPCPRASDSASALPR